MARPSRMSADEQYARLLAFRSSIREFEHWSAQQAQTQGMTGTQHQLLLAIRGHPGADGPTITQVADMLVVRHHTAVELATRAQELGLVVRTADPTHHRVVHLTLTAEGERRLHNLTTIHLAEYKRRGPHLISLLHDLS